MSPLLAAFGLVIYIVLSFALAASILWLLARAAASQKIMLVPYAVLVILAAIAIWPLVTNRQLVGFNVLLEAGEEQIGAGLWINRLCNLFLLFTLAAGLFRISLCKSKGEYLDWWLMLAFLIYYGTNYILNAAFGTFGGFLPQSLYVCAFSVAIFLAAAYRQESYLGSIRNGLLVFCFAGLVVAPFSPWTVIQDNYTEGLSIYRYWGLASHANTMGPILVVSQCFMLCFPFSRKGLNWGGHVLLAGMLIATQSKTAIFCSLVCCFYLGIYQGRLKAARTSLVSLRPHSVGPYVALISLCLFILASLFVDLGDIAGLMDGGGSGSSNVLTLTNRDIIWAAALKEFDRNILFGYGPSIFDEGFRYAIRIKSAIHAHNQIVHALSSAGLVGFLGLLFYIVVLLKRVGSAARSTNGLTVAMFILIAIRSVTEIPLTLHAPVSSEFLMHAILLLVITQQTKRGSASVTQPGNMVHIWRY